MQSSTLLRSLALFLGSLFGSTLPAQNLVHEVIYTDLPGWPQNDVPGMPGVHFYDSSSYTWAYGYLAVSPDGDHALIAATDDWSSAALVLMVNGQTVLHQDGSAPWAAGELVDRLSGPVAINRNGAIALYCSTDGPSSSNEYVLRLDTGWTVVAQESGAVAAVPGATYNGMDSPTIDDSGTIGFQAYIAGGSFNNGLFHGAQVLARANFDAPTGQLTGSNAVYTAFRNGHQLRLSPDGSRWATVAYLTYPTVLAVDNAVVVQENYAIPGSGSSTLAYDGYSTSFDSANRWYGLGRYLPANSNDRWAVREGVILGRTGQETYTGSGFNWGNQIEFVTGDAAGNYYVGGDYDIPPYGMGRVIAKNGTTPLLSNGDTIDMNGDGVFDDNVTMILLQPFGQATDDGSVYAVARVHDANQNDYGTVFLRIGLPRPEIELFNLVAGQTAELKLRFASPGDLVLMGYSLAGAGPTTVSSPWGPLEVALSSPFVQLPAMTADVNGEAVHSTTVPPGAAGVQVWAHAAVVHSNRATLTLPLAEVVL